MLTRFRTQGVQLCAIAAVVLLGAGGVRLAGAATSSASTSVVPVTPYRILDTRNGIGAPA